MDDQKKPYPFKIMDFLIFEEKDCNPQIHKALLQRDIDGKIPAFFYRHSVMTDKPAYIDFFGGYTVHFDYALKSISELEHLDFILSHARYDHGKLVFSMPKKDLEEMLSYDYDAYFEYLVKIGVKISSSDGSSVKFNIFDNYKSGSENVTIEFGRILRIFYAFDYLINHKKYIDLFGALKRYDKQNGTHTGQKMIPVLRNLFSRTKRSHHGIPLDERVFQKGGIYFDTADTVEFKNFLKGRKDNFVLGLAQAGLSYGIETNTLTMNDRYTAAVAPKVFIDNISSIEIDTEKKQASSAVSAGENEDVTKEKRKPVVFELLELNERYADIARKEGIQEEDIERTFELFKITYGELQEQKPYRSKYKDPYRCFGNYLSMEKKRSGDIPNSGKAENIVYDDKMDRITTAFGYTKDEIEAEFKEFRDYHIDLENERKNWVGSWRTWLKNVQSRSVQGNAYATKVTLENKHQIARLVDAGIRRMFVSVNINPLDVIRGKVEVSDVQVVSLPIPPSMGKGEDTLFEFKDPEVQARAVEEIIRDPQASFGKKKEEKEVITLDLDLG